MNQAEKQDMTVIVCFDGTLHGAKQIIENMSSVEIFSI